jgi:hypothetical protein
MTDVNGLGAGFGGTLAAPIWHDYMVAASDGYCGDFPQPTTYWSGTPYFGAHSSSNIPIATGPALTTPTPGVSTPGVTTPGVTTPGVTSPAATTPAATKPIVPPGGGPASGGAPKSGGTGVP